MSIVITNETARMSGENTYSIRLARGAPPIATFTHVREAGLAVCLRTAATAVEAHFNGIRARHPTTGGEE